MSTEKEAIKNNDFYSYTSSKMGQTLLLHKYQPGPKCPPKEGQSGSRERVVYLKVTSAPCWANEYTTDLQSNVQQLEIRLNNNYHSIIY